MQSAACMPWRRLVPAARSASRPVPFSATSDTLSAVPCVARTCRAGFPIPYNHLMRLSTPTSLHAAIGDALAGVPHVAFALVFGSCARGTAHAGSDVDVALDFGRGRRPGAYELGAIVSRLEEVAGQSVDIVVLEDAPPGLAYRVFRDGVAVLVRDRSALVERKARAILEYLDYQPMEEALSKAVLARRSR